MLKVLLVNNLKKLLQKLKLLFKFENIFFLIMYNIKELFNSYQI